MDREHLQLPVARKASIEMRAQLRVLLVLELADRATARQRKRRILGDVGTEFLGPQRSAQTQLPARKLALVCACRFAHPLALVLRVERVAQHGAVGGNPPPAPEAMFIVDGPVGGRRELDPSPQRAPGHFTRDAGCVEAPLVERRARLERAARLGFLPADDVREDRLTLHVDARRAGADQLDPLDGAGGNALQDGFQGLLLACGTTAVDQHVARCACEAADLCVAFAEVVARQQRQHVECRSRLHASKERGWIRGDRRRALRRRRHGCEAQRNEQVDDGEEAKLQHEATLRPHG